jgi:Mitochondrial carrier protein
MSSNHTIMMSSSRNNTNTSSPTAVPTATKSGLRKPSLLQSTFFGGTAAIFAVNFTHPIDLVKSRIQVSNYGIIQTCSNTMRNEGFAAFWKGLPWAYCREGSYTAIRIGGEGLSFSGIQPFEISKNKFVSLMLLTHTIWL